MNKKPPGEVFYCEEALKKDKKLVSKKYSSFSISPAAPTNPDKRMTREQYVMMSDSNIHSLKEEKIQYYMN